MVNYKWKKIQRTVAHGTIIFKEVDNLKPHLQAAPSFSLLHAEIQGAWYVKSRVVE